MLLFHYLGRLLIPARTCSEAKKLSRSLTQLHLFIPNWIYCETHFGSAYMRMNKKTRSDAAKPLITVLVCTCFIDFFSPSSAPYPNKRRVSCSVDFCVLLLHFASRYRNMLSINKIFFPFSSGWFRFARIARFMMLVKLKGGNLKAKSDLIHKCVVFKYTALWV